VSFALRMPPAVKAAALALTKSSFYEWGDDDVTIRAVEPSSINTALIYLLESGLLPALQHLEKEIVRNEKRLRAWHDVAGFFINNRTATHADFNDLTIGPAGRTLIEEHERDEVKISREWAFHNLSNEQWKLDGRIATRIALQQALNDRDSERRQHLGSLQG
jgi:hypothetical protein